MSTFANILNLRLGALAVTAALGLGLAASQQAAATEHTDGYFQRTDRDRDGKVSRNEYRTRMIDVFYSADRNRDGYLMFGELEAADQATFRRADRDGDGRLNLREFLDQRAQDFERADADDSDSLSADEAR